jgi:hypothetical protein
LPVWIGSIGASRTSDFAGGPPCQPLGGPINLFDNPIEGGCPALMEALAEIETSQDRHMSVQISTCATTALPSHNVAQPRHLRDALWSDD